MKLKMLFLSGCISGAIVVFGFPATAAAVQECLAGKPTAASYTWNFQGEANAIFQDIQSDARQALNHAEKLDSFKNEPTLSWESHADQLAALKSEVDDMGGKLCRLETIRRAAAPWQQTEIDRIASTLRLMANNTQDAILFVDSHQDELWLATYHEYTDNLYNEAGTLADSVGNAVTYANVSKEYQNLRHKLGVPASS